MAFNILTTKFKADKIINRTLDTSFLDLYYRKLPELLIEKTNVETPTDYFFCQDFANGKDLLILGSPNTKHKKIFKSAGKGKEGFDAAKISIGTCFFLQEKNKKVLCFRPNKAISSGKKSVLFPALNKIRRTYMSIFNEFTWIISPLPVHAKVEVVQDKKTSKTNNETSGFVEIDKNKITKEAKNLEKGIRKFKKETISRYKKGQTTTNDVAFTEVLIKTASLFLTELTQTDPDFSKQFSSLKKALPKNISQWKKILSSIQYRKKKKETFEAKKQLLKKVVDQMNTNRTEIKNILKRVNLKKIN